jgi:hypothetical protein
MKMVNISNWKYFSLYFWLCGLKVGRYSSFGIATRYRLDGPGIESRWGEIFLTHPNRPWVPPSLLYNGYRFSFTSLNRLGSKVNHPPTSSAEVKERVGRYLYFPSWPSCPVTEWNFRVKLITVQIYIFHFSFIESRVKVVEISDGKFSSLHFY